MWQISYPCGNVVSPGRFFVLSLVFSKSLVFWENVKAPLAAKKSFLIRVHEE
jgi:hypothetical protein